MQCIHQSKNGFALSIVLWIVAALLLGIVFIVSFSKKNLKLTEKLQYKLETRVEAESLLEILKFLVLTSEYNGNSLIIHQKLPYDFPNQIVLDGRNYMISNDINISMQDASSLLNVLNPSPKKIAMLAADKNRELKYAIEDSLNDWVDKDNVVKLNGAEEAFYRLKKLVSYIPRNTPAIQSVDELRIIHGLDQLSSSQWQVLKSRLFYSKGATVNLSLIDALYLSKLLHLNISEARALVESRDNLNKFINLMMQNKYYNDEEMGFALSFKIKIAIIVKNHSSISKLYAFINFRKLSENRVSVDKFEIY